MAEPARADVWSSAPPDCASWSRPRLRADCHGLDLNRVTLRFANAQTEQSFAKLRMERVNTGLQVLGLVILLMGGVTFASRDLRAEDWDDPAVFKAAQQCQFFDGLIAIWGCMMFLFAKLQQRWLFLSPMCIEVVAVPAFIVLHFLCFMTDVYFVARLADVEDPFEGRGLAGKSRNDAWWVIVCIGLVSITHNLVPIRWAVVSILEPVAVLFYAVPTFLLGNGGWAILGTLACLVVMSGYGCRELELQERQAFCQIIKERTLRTQAEFVLDLSDGPPHGLFADPRGRNALNNTTRPANVELGTELDDAGSEVSSTVFRDHGAASTHQRLRSMSEIGKRERWLLQTMHMDLKPTTLEKGDFGASSMALSGELHGTPVDVKMGWAADQGHLRASLPALMNEIRALRQVRHPNITLFHGACIDQQECVIAIVTERTHGLTLGDFVRQGCAPVMSSRRSADTTLTAKHRVLVGVGCALRYLHEHQPVLVHGDLRDTSIIINEAGRPKLSSFGFAAVLTRDSKLLGGAPAPDRVPWMAPEMLASRKVCPPSTAADVFGFGRIVHFIITGRNVAEYCSNQKIISLARSQRVPTLPWPVDAQGSLFLKFTGQCKALAQRCSNAKASERPPAFEVLEDLRAWPAQFIQEQEESGGNHVPEWSGVPEDAVHLVPWRTGLQAIKNLEMTSAARMEWKSLQRRAGNEQPLDHHRSARARRTSNASSEMLPAIAESDEEAENSDGHPDKLVTGLVTRQLMLIDAARSWKLSKQSGCCAYHIALRELHKVSRDLCAAACTPQFQLCSGRQCPNCLALSEKEDGSFEPASACDFCGQEWPQAALGPEENPQVFAYHLENSGLSGEGASMTMESL